MKSRRIPVTSRLSLIPYGYLEGGIKHFTGISALRTSLAWGASLGTGLFYYLAV
jgi:hypothetical protein